MFVFYNVTAQSNTNLFISDSSIKANYFYAINKEWIENTTIPKNMKRWGTLDQLANWNNKNVKKIIQDIEKKAISKEEKALQNFIQSIKKAKEKESSYLNEIKKELQLIEKIKTKEEFTYYNANQMVINNSSLFKLEIVPDFNNKTKNCLTIKPSEKLKIDSLSLSIFFDKINFKKEETNKIIANAIYFENELFSINNPKESSNNPTRYTLQRINFTFKQIDIESYFTLYGIPKVDFIQIQNEQYFIQLTKQIEQIPILKLKNYLLFKLACKYAPLLINFHNQLNQDEYEFIFQQIKNVPLYNELLEKKFIELYFKKESKEKITGIINELKWSFEERIKQSTWMSLQAKKTAVNKLNNMNFLIGCPDNWNSTDSLIINPNNLIYNINVSNKTLFYRKLNILKNNQVYDKWEVPVYSTNIYYNQVNNTITIPAGILQPPIFDTTLNLAELYGKLGCLIGHEIIHGFDLKGAQFNDKSELNYWWTKEDKTNYEKKINQLKILYARVLKKNNQFSNREKTIEEDIADMGGLTIALQAFLKKIDTNKEKELYAFFFNFAQLHKCIYTENEINNRLVNDNHNLAEYRVNVTLMNCI